MKEEATSARIASLDVIRCIAVCSIIVMHANETLVDGGGRWFAVSFGTLGVPLFVLLTGYLMVPRQYDERYLPLFFRNNVLPLFISLELWNIIWYLISVLNGNPMSKKTVISVALFTGDLNGGFWFLPMILGAYVCLPLLSWVFHRYACKGYIKFIFGIMLYIGIVIPTLSELFASLHIDFPMAGTYFTGLFTVNVAPTLWSILLVLGALLQQGKFGKIPAWVLWVIAVGSFLILMCERRFFDAEQVYFEANKYANVFTVCCSVALFELLRRFESICAKTPLGIRSVVEYISKSSLAVYMIHFTVLPYSLKIVNALPLVNHGICALIIACCITLLCSCTIGFLLGLIPILRRYLLLMK